MIASATLQKSIQSSNDGFSIINKRDSYSAWHCSTSSNFPHHTRWTTTLSLFNLTNKLTRANTEQQQLPLCNNCAICWNHPNDSVQVPNSYLGDFLFLTRRTVQYTNGRVLLSLGEGVREYMLCSTVMSRLYHTTMCANFTCYNSGFQLGDNMSPPGNISDFGGGHNTICCHGKIIAFMRFISVALREI